MPGKKRDKSIRQVEQGMEGTGVGFLGERHYQREKNVPDIRFMCCKVPDMCEEQQRPTEQRIMWEQKTGGFLGSWRPSDKPWHLFPMNCRDPKGFCAEGDV